MMIETWNLEEVAVVAGQPDDDDEEPVPVDPPAGLPVGLPAGLPVGLPTEVRRAVVELAAEVLGTLAESEVPAQLRKVRAFTRARRSRAGAAPLALALERDQPFRHRVAAAWRAANPELAAALEEGQPVAAVAPELVLAGVYLTRAEGWEAELERWLALVAVDQLAVERSGRNVQAGAEAEALRADLAQARAQTAAAQRAQAELAEEATALRREQRRLRSDADRSRAAAREAERQLNEESERLGARLAELEGQVRQAEHQAQEALEQLDSARRAARDGRSLGELRARLLLDTIVESASALRRELALPPPAKAPADLVAEQLTTQPVLPKLSPRGLDGDDPALLAELLRIPRAHVLVDGYNVTMEAYAELPLVDQRRLLIDALSALAARTGAEVTCCFDGADVDGRPQALVRKVRVLFSDPGMTADELIRRLLRAEPQGRMVVVVSSDREVAEAALAASARSMPSKVLLRLLGMGRRDQRH